MNIPARFQDVKVKYVVAFDTGSCWTLNSKTLCIKRDDLGQK